MAYVCGSGFKGTYDYPVRHAIDLSGVYDISVVTIPSELTKFREFLYNPKKRRLSFKTARLSYCITVPKFENYEYKSSELYSVDPNIHLFNNIFSKANQRLNINELQTYDFIDKGDEQAGSLFVLNDIRNSLLNTPKKIINSLSLGTNLLVFGGVALILFKLFGKSNPEN